jgi:hypothetical protein
VCECQHPGASSPAYIKGWSDNLVNAWVMFEKFHVIQNVVEAYH